jgi:hypothetical protein
MFIRKFVLREGEGGEGGGGDGAVASWRDSLPEELRNSPSLVTTKDVASLAKQFVDQQAHLGNAVRIPSENASPEDRQAFYNKLIAKVPGLIVRPDMANGESREAYYKMVGRPDKPEDYKLVEGIQDSDYTKLLRDAAHKQGLNQAQFTELLSVFPAIAEDGKKAAEKADFERKEAIAKEWGAATEKNTLIAASVAEKTGAPPELVQAVKDGKAGMATLKWLHGLASQFGVEGANMSQDKGTIAVMTPSEALARIAEVRNNKAHPVWNKRDPQHRLAVDEWAKLHKYANFKS